MTSAKNIIFSAVIVTLLVIGLLKWGAITVNSKTTVVAKETAYERILRTGEIRCGYSVWKPDMWIDPISGEKVGIFPDLITEAGKRLGLKIIWQEELGWGSLVESVKSGRVDMACAGYWLNPSRIKNLQPSVSQIYSPMYVYMRADDTRKFTTPEDLNADHYTISTIDGSAEKQIIALRFSKSKNITLPELDDSSEVIQDLTTHKADFLILDSATANSYMQSNPGKIKNAFPNVPMHMFPTVMLLPPEEPALKGMIDNILLDIEHDGTLDVILRKYDAAPLFLRNQQPIALAAK
jgi:polar amino acid transport system substrate-binding protein